MDSRFVPNITIGPPVIESIRKCTRLPLDVHLLIVEPERYMEKARYRCLQQLPVDSPLLSW